MSFDFTSPVEIVPTAAANLRSKNKLREHNLKPAHMPKGAEKLSSKTLAELCTLFRCEDCNWLGWLPNKHFEIKRGNNE